MAFVVARGKTSPNDDVITVDFNEYLPTYNRVGLKHLSARFKHRNVTIDSSNDLIKVKRSTDAEFADVRVPHGNYRTDDNHFLDAVKNGLNAFAGIHGSDFDRGCEYDVDGGEEEVNISMIQRPYELLGDRRSAVLFNCLRTNEGDDIVFERDNLNNETSYVGDSKPINRGNAEFNCKIKSLFHNVGGVRVSGRFIIGLSTLQPSRKTAIEARDLLVGMEVTYRQRLAPIYLGTRIDRALVTNKNASNNDFVSISKHGNKFVLQHVDGINSNVTTIATIEVDARFVMEDLYPVVLFTGPGVVNEVGHFKRTEQITEVLVIASSFEEPAPTEFEPAEGLPPSPDDDATQMTLDFNQEMAKFLGFQVPIRTKEAQKEAHFKADLMMDLVRTFKMLQPVITVESLDLPIWSFDSGMQGRAAILGVIPNTALSTEGLSHTFDNALMFPINPHTPIVNRRLRFRLTTRSGATGLQVEGDAVIGLVFD